MNKETEKIKKYCKENYKKYSNNPRRFESGMRIAFSNVMFFIDNELKEEEKN